MTKFRVTLMKSIDMPACYLVLDAFIIQGCYKGKEEYKYAGIPVFQNADRRNYVDEAFVSIFS